MKILLANKFFYPRGGDCIYTIQLKQLLEQHGHEVAIFAMQHPENIESKYSQYWPSEVAFLNKSTKQLLAALQRPFGANEVKEKWKQLLTDFQPDIVHLNNIHSQLSPVITQLAKEQNIPTVWTMHDYKLICPAYTFTDLKGKVCEDCLASQTAVIQKKCIKGSLLASLLGYCEAQKWNKEKLEYYTSRFISPSLFLKQKMEQGGYASQQITHIYNFADDTKFNQQIIEQRMNEAVFVGRLSKEKGVETLCRAFQKISSTKLIVIGDGPLRSKLEKQYASEHIQFLGFQSWEIIKVKLERAAFLIIPSEWYENNPLTVIESLALGTPVLGARIGGIPELIEEGINGMTFVSGDVNDLQVKIREMLNKRDWNHLQISAYAAQKFSARKYYKELMKIYQEHTSLRS